jgi:hypothetical protein
MVFFGFNTLTTWTYEALDHKSTMEIDQLLCGVATTAYPDLVLFMQVLYSVSQH